ncbi:hypothetical protein M2280_006156, partial [Prescottella agglutinans]|nr:hypothetical protein [Prescottella agglutinans]
LGGVHLDRRCSIDRVVRGASRGKEICGHFTLRTGTYQT